MCDLLSNKLGNPALKPWQEPTVTVSVPTDNDKNQDSFPTKNLDDFNDFISIPNNSNDFDIGKILQDVAKHKESIQNVQSKPDNQIALQPSMTTEQMDNIPTSNSNVLNVNQAQNNPFVPRMYFPNRTVTINYNFSGPTNPNKS